MWMVNQPTRREPVMNGKEKKILLGINQDIRSTCQLIRENIYAGDADAIAMYSETLQALALRLASYSRGIPEPTTTEEGK